jgi:hypothetical protein
MTRTNLIAQDAWAESLSIATNTLQHSVEYAAAVISDNEIWRSFMKQIANDLFF